MKQKITASTTKTDLFWLQKNLSLYSTFSFDNSISKAFQNEGKVLSNLYKFPNNHFLITLQIKLKLLPPNPRSLFKISSRKSFWTTSSR